MDNSHPTDPTTDDYVSHAKELWNEHGHAARPVEVTIMEVLPVVAEHAPAQPTPAPAAPAQPAAPKDSDYADAWHDHA